MFDSRHQFYLHSRLELLEGRLKVADWSSVVRLVAWIAQADIGDYDPLSPPNALYSQCCQIQPAERCESKPLDLIHRIVQQHKEMKVRFAFLRSSPFFSNFYTRLQKYKYKINLFIFPSFLREWSLPRRNIGC